MAVEHARFRDKDTVMSDITFDCSTKKVSCVNHTDKVLDQAMDDGECTWEEFMEFLEDRAFPRTRANADYILEQLGLLYYDPLDIVRITHCVQVSDDFYVEFNEEALDYVSISVRCQNVQKYACCSVGFSAWTYDGIHFSSTYCSGAKYVDVYPPTEKFMVFTGDTDDLCLRVCAQLSTLFDIVVFPNGNIVVVSDRCKQFIGGLLND